MHVILYIERDRERDRERETKIPNKNGRCVAKRNGVSVNARLYYFHIGIGHIVNQMVCICV